MGKMKQTASLIATLLFGLSGADHVPGHPHAHPHHQPFHHGAAHHGAFHHAPHHQAVHHPVHHQAVHHQAVHHQAVHHAEPVAQAYEPTEDVVDCSWKPRFLHIGQNCL